MRNAVAAVAILACTLAAGCSGTADDDAAISHVHGLAVTPEGTLLVATHHGMVKGVAAGEAWSWRDVGRDRFDFMGFTQDRVEPGTYYASGHPTDAAAYGGPHLGLLRSRDEGATWETRSLRGEVDFHALTAMGSGAGHVAGW
ncbi:MAG TPA: hypothetical protein VFH47_03830, partial [Candidatus Thermoplasmatota archaeon]|nr:hypothetical protein [Candidatus Thermoplasmatota archaeon]